MKRQPSTSAKISSLPQVVYSALPLLALLLFSGLSPAAAFPLPDPGSNESAIITSTVDGQKFFDQMRKNLDSYQDYTVDSSVYMFRPSAEQVGGGNICYKKINLFKLTVRSKGSKDGALVVRTRDGKIRACGGTHLRFLKMTLTEDSRLLQIPNGFNAVKSDLGNLLATISTSLNAGKKLRVSPKPMAIPRIKQNLYVLQVVDSAAPGSDVSEQIYVDPTNNVPVEWDIYRSGKLFSVAVFENFKSNIGLDDNAFQL